MRYGMNDYKIENDEVSVDVVAGDPEVVADAQEAAGDIQEVVQLCDAVEAYNDVHDDIQTLHGDHQVQVSVMDGDYAVTNGEIKVSTEDDVTINVDAKELGENVGDAQGEVLTPESTDGQADEASAKLEHDLAVILSRVNGTVRSSRFGGSSLGKKIESDFNLSGKRGYRARVEGISEAGKKVWEHIKAFFAKIWDFMKSLFERFTALFKSNKSVLEGLKKKLEDMSDDDLSEFKDKGEVGQQLAAYTEIKDLHKLVMSSPDSMDKQIQESLKKVTGKGKNEKVAWGNRTTDKENDLTISVSGIDKGKLDGIKSAKGTMSGVAGVSGEGIILWGTVGGKYTTISAKIKNPSSGSFSKAKSGARDALIDLCENGIELCEELNGSLIKDAEKSFNDFRKEAEDAFKEMYDKDDENKKSDELKARQKESQAILTSAVSTFSKVIATVGNQPSQIVTAVRQGMSLYGPAKK